MAENVAFVVNDIDVDVVVVDSVESLEIRIHKDSSAAKIDRSLADQGGERCPGVQRGGDLSTPLLCHKE